MPGDDAEREAPPDRAEDRPSDGDDEGPTGPRDGLRRTRERLGEEADRAATEFDQSVVDLLAWLLDTETRARIYVYLRQHPESTSEEIADGTGLYPSTVREALAELHDEEMVTRSKRESAGAGNNPFEYEAISPSLLVRNAAGQVQRQLNAVFNLDRRLGGESEADDESPVTITVDADDDVGGDSEGDADDDADDDTGGNSEGDADDIDGPDDPADQESDAR